MLTPLNQETLTPSSLPPLAPPAQPDQAAYPISALYLFTQYTRSSYQSAFDQQAPVYDATRPPQLWFDTSASPGPYQTVQVNAPGANPPAQMVPLPVPANAGVPNLAGAYEYPAWQNLPATTPAVQSWPGVSGPAALTPVPVSSICSQDDAQAVADSMGPGASIVLDPADPQIQWGSETRRVWDVILPGGTAANALNAAGLRAEMTAQILNNDGSYVSGGAGSPGSWTALNTPNPVWVSTPDPGLSAAGVPVLVPCRSLLANEQFIVAMLGTVEIGRTDMGPAATASALTPAQQQFMLAVLQAMNAKYSLGVAGPS